IAVAENFKSVQESIKGTGLVLDKEGQESLLNFQKAVRQLEEQFEGLKNIIGADTAEIFIALAKEGKEAFESLKADPAVVEGLKNLLETTKALVFVLGEVAIAALKNFVKELSDLGLLLAE